jgi:flagellar export protein FliJ
MAYKFPLETLLRVRTLREEKEERTLQQIGAEIARTAKLQEEIANALERVSARQGSSTGAALKGSDLHAHYAEISGLMQSREDLLQHRTKLEDLQNRQMRAYTTARQNREMLSDLSETQRASYQADLAKREQKVIDDNFAARRKSA